MPDDKIRPERFGDTEKSFRESFTIEEPDEEIEEDDEQD